MSRSQSTKRNTSEEIRVIAKLFDLREEDVEWAVQQVTDHLLDYPNPGRKRVNKRVAREDAVDLVKEWMQNGNEWAVDIYDPVDVAEFIRSRAVGCSWVVLQSKLRTVKAKDKLKAGLRLIAEWLDHQFERRTGAGDLRCLISEIEEGENDL